jgi:hypothetical protein
MGAVMSAVSTRDGLSSKNAAIEAKRALVRRIAESSTFGKSERLSSFLICICDLTLSGRASEINEQKIGTTVFGRPLDYDSSIDGIVRPQASRLRHRLDRYFSGEGVNEPVRITLPRGSYVPVFEPNQGKSSATDSSSVPVVSPAVSSSSESTLTLPSSFRAARLSWILVIVLLAALLVVGVRSREHFVAQTATSSSLHPLWSILFRPNQTTIVVPSDTGLVMWQSATGQSVDLERYLGGGYRAQSVGDTPTGQVNSTDLASRRYTSIVDLDIVKGLAQIADSQKSKLDVNYARDVRPNDLKQGNIVLIGAAAANPWVELFEPKMNFVFSNAHIRQYTVLNRAPVGPEPSSWTSNYDDAQHRVYGVVAFLPNLSGTGSVLILEGTSMAGTESAWDFVADDSAFLPFVNRISRTDGSIPHFQLVLDSINLTGSSTKRNVLAWRVMD